MAADPCSFSSLGRCVTKHLSLSLHLDFVRHVIRGRAELTVEALEHRVSALTLDTRDLKIASVSANGQAAPFTMGPKHSFKGTPLDVALPFHLSRGQHAIVAVTYETSPSATALQWLAPEQTAGKQQPYLFSQCQAHHCRSMIPCQDSPSVKHTYYAQVSAPKGLVAVMSAIRDGQEVDPEDNGRVVYRFRQPVPMPSYLIAIVAGALESREIGPRSRVWSERELVEKAAFEFSQTEDMLRTAEQLAGPYVWGQYDILVLPPSFPYGGMENPCLTFATPTLLAGDRSLSNVIAHEISHSWTGNLVTNKTWEHFWLNEGHTVYLERMIGRSMEGEPFRQFKARGGWKELQDSVNTFGANNPLTNLVPSLEGVDPDDAFSSVPYEKGFALLYHLEELMGGPEVFMGFVKSYIQMFAYSSVTSDEWKSYLFTYFKDKVDILNKVDWNAWMYTPGMPPVKPRYDSTLADACIALSQRWIKAKDQDLSSFRESDLKTLSSHQLIEFLSLLLHEDPLPLTHVKKMQQLYDLNENKRPVLTSQPNGLAPISSARPGLPPPPERQTAASDAARHCRQGSATAKTTDGKPKPAAMTPEQAMKQFMSKMSSFEHHEVFGYPEVFFVGPFAKKRSGVMGGANNGGYDDDQGSYIHVPHDHVSYRYEVLKVIGKGSFGQVVKAFDHKSQTHVALKMVRNEKRFHRQAAEEIRILEHLKKQDRDSSMNVIHMLENFSFRGHICMTFELLSMNLYELIKKNKFQGFSLPLVRKFAHSLLQCLDSLQRNRIIHCDLKPENILLKQQGRSGIKVIDFGSSCYEHQRVYTYIQSRFYRAPEVILGSRYGMPIDVWSLGCILAELLTGYPLLPGEDEADQLACIMELLGMPSQKLLEASKRAKNFVSSKGYPRYCSVTALPEGGTVLNAGRSRRGKVRGPPGSKDWTVALKGCDDPLFLDFLKQCLEWDPAHRMTPSQALRHPWLRRRLPKPPAGTTASKRSTASDGAVTSTGSASSKARTNVAAITDANGNIQPRTVLPKLVS
ncbi:dual specificity tyrosine-phosphorylation-regulated kinase 2 [Brachionichthys hirsutus]|uniref:dual specificity tyrosine-phosphorylation-regulated kinase 2 n=1 Tax=Brachionichthys hirsutus TaxID=412623 RepID=UPI003604CB17